MAIFIKSVGCDCPECGPDPCTAGGCFCDGGLTAFATSAGTDSDSRATYGSFLVDTEVYLEFGIGPEVCSKARLTIKADGVTIYDSGCLTYGSYTDSVTVPAGTALLELIVDAGCDSACAESACLVTVDCIP